MSIRKPPRLATWLLDRLLVSEQNPALIGDLLEEFQAGRTAGWYWRQALSAVVTSLGRSEFRPYRKAVLAGWSAEICAVSVLWSFHLPPKAHGFGYLWSIPASSALVLAFSWLTAHVAQAASATRRPLCAAYEVFSRYLLVYCLFAMLSPRIPAPLWAILQAWWLAADILNVPAEWGSGRTSAK